MSFGVEFTDQFELWWLDLTEKEQNKIAALVEVLEEQGTKLGFPYSSNVIGSRHGQMRELRIQHKGKPYRVLYAFDPRRAAILLIGGNKGGDKQWYKTNVPIADSLYDKHLEELSNEDK